MSLSDLFRAAHTTGNARFPLAKRGYDRTEVDQYLAEVTRRAAEGDESLPGELLHRGFTVVKRGYDRVEVQRHLAALADEQLFSLSPR